MSDDTLRVRAGSRKPAQVVQQMQLRPRRLTLAP